MTTSGFDPEAPPVTLLYVPASNARALEKAPGLGADMIIVDLEDAVPAEGKADARVDALAALQRGFGGALVAVRINTDAEQGADLGAVSAAPVAPDLIVVPKVERGSDLSAAAALGLPMLAMIETPGAVLDARTIARGDGVVGLIAGLNDLAHALRLPPGHDRAALGFAMQGIVLGARAAGVAVYDGVYNAIDDADGFACEAAEARALGFDGKTLIHPSQVAPCAAAFAPDAAEVATARALIAAASGGAQRFAGQMIEDMHVAAAKALLARARDA